MQVYQLIKLLDAPYQLRIDSFIDFRTYCDRWRDELEGVETILLGKSIFDYDFKAEVAKIVELNPQQFLWAGSDIILKTSDKNRIMNLEIKGKPYIEDNTLIIHVRYGSNSFDDKESLYRLR